MSKPLKIPPVGSFPGYKLGRSLFATWTNMLNQQADIWNTTWSALLSGDYKTGDYFSALAQSLKSSTSALEQSVHTLDRRDSPPWSRVRFNRAQSTEIRVGQSIDGYDKLTCTYLSFPGPSAAERGLPNISVTQVSTYAAVVAFANEATAPPGEYLAVVTCRRYRQPLAVITVSIAPPRALADVDKEAKKEGGTKKPAKKAGKTAHARRKAAKQKPSARRATRKTSKRTTRKGNKARK